MSRTQATLTMLALSVLTTAVTWYAYPTESRTIVCTVYNWLPPPDPLRPGPFYRWICLPK